MPLNSFKFIIVGFGKVLANSNKFFNNPQVWNKMLTEVLLVTEHSYISAVEVNPKLSTNKTKDLELESDLDFSAGLITLSGVRYLLDHELYITSNLPSWYKDYFKLKDWLLTYMVNNSKNFDHVYFMFIFS